MNTTCKICDKPLRRLQITMKCKFCSRDCYYIAQKGVNTFKGGNAQAPLPYMAEYAALLVPLGYVMDSYFVNGPRPGRATYKLDFALVDAKVNIELDGSSHKGARLERDARRDTWLRSLGWHVIRIDVRKDKKTAEEMAATERKRGKNISKGKKGKKLGPMPEQQRKKIGDSLRGRINGPLSDDHRETLRLTNLGKHHTEKTKEKMRASQIARQQREKESTK